MQDEVGHNKSYSAHPKSNTKKIDISGGGYVMIISDDHPTDMITFFKTKPQILIQKYQTLFSNDVPIRVRSKTVNESACP